MAKKLGSGKLVAGHPSVWSEEKELKKYYKQLDTEEIEDWAKGLKETFKPCPEQPSIHRMRAAMAVLYHYFPRETKAKKTSKYKELKLEQLVAMADEHNVPVEVCDDERIMRMRLIMALRASKVIE